MDEEEANKDSESPSEKVTPSENVEKESGNLDDIEDPVVPFL